MPYLLTQFESIALRTLDSRPKKTLLWFEYFEWDLCCAVTEEVVNSRNIAILWGLERSVPCPKLPAALRLRAGFVVLHVSHSHFLFPALAKGSFQRAAASVHCRRCPPPPHHHHPPHHRHRHRHLHHRHRLLHHRHLHLHHVHRHRHHLLHHHHHRRRRSRHRHHHFRHRHRHCIFIIFIFIVIIITTIIMISSSISNISNNTLNLCFQFCDSKTIVTTITTTTTTTTTTPSAASSSTSTHLQLHNICALATFKAGGQNLPLDWYFSGYTYGMPRCKDAVYQASPTLHCRWHAGVKMQLHGCSCLRHSFVSAGDIRLYRCGMMRVY